MLQCPCNLNFNEYQLCKYCAHVPYVPLPLRYQDTGSSYSSDGTQPQNNVNQYRCVKIDYIQLLEQQQVDHTEQRAYVTGPTVPMELPSKFNEFWDHLELGKLQIKQRLMDIKTKGN
ncbi:hypothetical protein Cantr_01267 [Candida viswanathii]|uniref:Uncharacterized protein n=1 Tax=Candida viswanathii TaxID=5486 RepID=A0A367YHI2_9ASCO|nr:hypothetical protein Cantr_01267 [Candida viswanathii]